MSLYLAQHTPPPEVKFLLDGATLESNQKLVDEGTGVPWDIPAPVTMVANEYDGWSEFPDNAASPGYNLAVQNANAGKRHVHNDVNAQLHNPANVVTTRGTITAILIPTQKLPLNDGLRLRGLNAEADSSMLSSALRLTMPTVAQSHRRSSWRRLAMSKWSPSCADLSIT